MMTARRFRALLGSERGSMVVELAIALPLFVLFLAFMAQAGMTMLERQRVGRALSDATFALARAAHDGVAAEAATPTALSIATGEIKAEGPGDYRVYLRRVDITESGPVEVWLAEAGTLDAGPDWSKIRVAGGALQLPHPLSLRTGDRVFVAEMYRRHRLAIEGIGSLSRSYAYRVLVR